LTVAREKLRIIIIVFNDASLSLIDIKQQRKRYRRAGVALGHVDWCAVAEGFGLPAFHAKNESELSRALEGAIATGGPGVIDVSIDPSNYSRTLQAIRG
jgi:acetolactate synthase I/II/III large subunit